MSSKLLINVNDATPSVIPDTSAPDTGMFSVSHTDGVSFNASMVLPIIGIAALVIAIVVGAIIAISRRKKVNRFTTHTNKHLVAKLTTLSVVVLLGALGVLNADKLTSMVNAADNSEEDTLTITASDIKIDVDLNDKAVFATGESVVTVDSATRGGYTLMAYVDSITTDLANETNKSSSSTITMLDANLKTPKALEDNTWGMSITKPSSQEDETFRGLPTSLEDATILKSTEDATVANDKTTVYYGTYITPDLDYGTYSGVTITYIAIANFACNPDATTIQEAVCMQDFAGPNRDQIVDSMTPETQYTLKDKRDKKSYTIAKLELGENFFIREAKDDVNYAVWMTQNLDLDLDSNTTYTNEDTDLGYNPETNEYETVSWMPIRSTYAATDTYTHEWCSGGVWDYNDNYCRNNYTPESYDAGDLYWNARLSTNDEWEGYFYDCDHSSSTPDCSHAINPLPSYVSSTGIPQYHLGNYYNWSAAIATNDSSVFNGYEWVEQSICPAGWTLPSKVHDDFSRLWDQYGFSDSSVNGSDALWTTPLYFVPSGFISGALTDVGFRAFFWASSPDANDRATGAAFSTNGYVESDNCSGRECGHPVRCVVRSYLEPGIDSAIPDDPVSY
ncbi:hypothetical protein IKT18_02025 [Candidatus Saccharibacteria bacterium]|nr:hypothetical protein [Candidatus Saccharibacteria bacterium]